MNIQQISYIFPLKSLKTFLTSSFQKSILLKTLVKCILLEKFVKCILLETFVKCILLKIIQISYLSNHNNNKIYINKPQSRGFFVGTMKGPHEYNNARDTLHHFEMHNLKFKAILCQGYNNYVELFPSKYWLNLHKRGLWNKFKYLMILVSPLVACN